MTNSRIRLHALAAGAKTSPRQPAPRSDPALHRLDGPFGRTPFTPMHLIHMSGDHVVASIDSSISDYAIGHLPALARARIIVPGGIDASLATAPRRVALGIMSDKAIDDIHDDDPWVCPVSLNLIRAHAPDARATIAAYRKVAALVGSPRGDEPSSSGVAIRYDGSDRRLTAEMNGGNWTMTRDAIEIRIVVPSTLCAGAVGRPVESFVEHAAFNGTDAIITDIDEAPWGITVAYRTSPTRLRSVPEWPGRRAR